MTPTTIYTKVHIKLTHVPNSRDKLVDEVDYCQFASANWDLCILICWEGLEIEILEHVRSKVGIRLLILHSIQTFRIRIYLRFGIILCEANQNHVSLIVNKLGCYFVYLVEDVRKKNTI